MGTGVGIPLHLAMHVLGLTVSLGLCAYAVGRRAHAGSAWSGIAVGGLLLAAAHLVVGMLLADPQGWPVVLRTAGYAGLAVGAAGGLAGTAAALAVLPPMGHLTAGLVGAMAALATYRGVLGRGRQVAWLAAGLVLWAAGDVALSLDPRLAAALSLAGSGAAGWWLLRRAATTSLFARVAGAFLAVLLVLAVGIASASGLVFTADLRDEQVRRLDEVAGAQARELAEGWPAELAATAELLAGGVLVDELRDALDGDRDRVARRAQIVEDLPGVDLVALIGGGEVLAAAREAGELSPADAAGLTGSELVGLARAGTTARGLLAGGQRRVLAVGAVPVAPRDAEGEPELDRLAGVLVLGRSLTDPAELAGIRDETAADVGLFVGGELAATTLPAEEAAGLPEALEGEATGSVTLSGETRFVATAPLPGVREPEAGTLVLALDPGAVASAESTATRSLFAVALAALAVAAGLAALVTVRVTRPIARLTGAATQVAAGDLGVRVGLDRDDEVGRLAGAFDQMTAALGHREAALRDAADTETALRARLEAVTASMGEALVAVNRGGRVTTANPAAGSLLGSAPEDLLGRPVDEVLIGRDEGGASLSRVLGDAATDALTAARGTIGPAAGDGPARHVEVAATAAPLRGSDGALRGRVYVLRDVSREVAAERMRTELIANVSHELKTPLTPIRGYAELLRQRDLGRDRTVAFAGEIVTSVETLERIVGLLVDLADLEAGRDEAASEPVALDPLVDGTLARWREQEPDRVFTRRLARDLPPVEGEPRLLERVLEELVHNAVKFSDGPVRIIAGREGDTVAVTVRDEGIGISPAALEGILEDFAQADASSTRHHGGLGLGLSIVQRILHRSGGTLAITSEPDRGSDVTVRLRAAGEATPSYRRRPRQGAPA